MRCCRSRCSRTVPGHRGGPADLCQLVGNLSPRRIAMIGPELDQSPPDRASAGVALSTASRGAISDHRASDARHGMMVCISQWQLSPPPEPPFRFRLDDAIDRFGMATAELAAEVSPQFVGRSLLHFGL